LQDMLAGWDGGGKRTAMWVGDAAGKSGWRGMAGTHPQRPAAALKCKSLDLILQTMSDLTIHPAAEITGEADPLLSMTALQAAAGGGRKAIIDTIDPLATPGSSLIGAKISGSFFGLRVVGAARGDGVGAWLSIARGRRASVAG
jgi:hypothetical protein